MAVKAAASEPAAPSEKIDPDRPGGQLELAHGEHEEDRERNAREEVRGRSAAGLRAEVRVSEDEAQPLLEVGPQARLLPVDRRDLGRSSTLRIRSRKRPEPTKLTASRRTAYGAVKTWTSTPPRPGAADLCGRAADLELRVAVDDLLALDDRRQVRLVRDVEEHLERADEECRPRTAAPSVSASAKYAIGTVARSAARPKSPTIRIGRRGSRSTHTPAGSVKRMNGRNSTVPSAATSKAVASRTRIATSGIASCPTCEPKTLIVSADHSFRKSGWRQRPPVGQKLRIVASWRQRCRGSEKRVGECVAGAVSVVRLLDVRDEAVQPLLEPTSLRGGQPNVDECGRTQLVVARCDQLVGSLAQHHRREYAASQLLRAWTRRPSGRRGVRRGRRTSR